MPINLDKPAKPATVAAPVTAPDTAPAPTKPAKPRKPRASAKPAAAKPAKRPAKPAPAKPAPVAAPQPTDAELIAAALEKRASERAALVAATGEAVQLAADFFAALDDNTISNPVKYAFKYGKAERNHVAAHTITSSASERACAACIAPALARGVDLADGVTFPRRFERDGHTFTIERGALSNAIAAGLCTFDNEAQTITLKSVKTIRSVLGSKISAFK